MTTLSRSEQIVAEKTVCVLLVRGESPDGGAIYAYVAVRADRLENFMQAQQSGTFYPEDYGLVIASGEGEPDEETRQRMEREYGFRHDKMVGIPDAGYAGDLTHTIAAAPAGEA